MACAFGCFSSISAVIVAIQFLAKVLPWIYENIIGPSVLGPKIKYLDYGDWAGKFEKPSFSQNQILTNHQAVFFPV